MHIEKSKDVVVISSPQIEVSGISSGLHYVSVQNGTGTIAAPEGVEITFVGPGKPESSVIEIRESSSDTGITAPPTD